MREDFHRADVRSRRRPPRPARYARICPQWRRHIIVWKLDRLARSMKQLIETIEGLRARGFGFRSLTEALDTTTPQGVLVFHLFSALADFERALIRERTAAGPVAAKRAGKTGGRAAKLLDGNLEPARTLLANPDIVFFWSYRPSWRVSRNALPILARCADRE